MTALWIILGIILFTAVILSLRIRLKADYDSTKETDGLRLKAGLGFIMITILPKKEKKTKKPRLSSFTYEKHKKRLEKERIKAEKKNLKDKAKAAKKAAEKAAKKAENRHVPFTERLRSVFDIVSLVFEEFPKLVSYMHTDVRYLLVSVGSDDAAKTAELYGGICLAATSFLTLLREKTKMRKERKGSIRVNTDFISGKCEAAVGFSLSVSLFSIVRIGWHALVWFIKNKIKNNNQD